MSDNGHAHPNYVAIWGWLLLLLFVSLATVYLPFSQGVTVTFIFIVAAVKACLVATYFMHLKFEEAVVRYVAILPVILFVIMILTLIPDIGIR